MNKRVVRRLLDTYFRRWWLYVLPFALFSAVGVAKAVTSDSGYRSVGVIDVAHGTLLSELTSIRGENFGYETPAASTARTLNSLLRTDSFIEAVADGAGLTKAVERGEIAPFGIRQAILSSPDGDNLLQVVAMTDDPALSANLAQATIDSFIDYVVTADVAESRAAEEFFKDQVESYQTELESAQKALSDYASAHPGGPQAERALDEQVEIDSLRSAVEQAQATYANAQQKSDEARLATEQSVQDVSQRLRIIQQPDVPSSPEPRLMKAVMTVVVFSMVGLLISGGAVVLGTVLDRTLRSVDDVEQLLGLSALAVIPEGRTKRSRRRSKRGASDVAAPTTRVPTRAATIGTTAERQRALKPSASVGTDGRSTAKRYEAQRDTRSEGGARQDPTVGSRRGGSDE